MFRGTNWTVLLSAICLMCIPANAALSANKENRSVAAPAVSHAGSTSTLKSEKAPTIKWFKEELRISPKYAEKTQGIYGLSWAHFMTMVFLVLFFLLGLVALLIRYMRTKALLRVLLEEKEDAGKS